MPVERVRWSWYERLRKARTRQIQIGSPGNATRFQLPDGPAADARNANLVSLPKSVGWIHGYDVLAEAVGGSAK